MRECVWSCICVCGRVCFACARVDLVPFNALTRLENLYRTLTDKLFREYRTLADKLFREKLYRTLTDKVFREKLYRTLTDKLFRE